VLEAGQQIEVEETVLPGRGAHLSDGEVPLHDSPAWYTVCGSRPT
jgi:hypothetical protein